MKKTVIHFIRHGQTIYNLEQRIQGTIDIDLSEVGIKQAENIPADKFLKDYDVAFHSSLTRSEDTLDIVLNKVKKPIIKKLSNLIIERSYGCFEGLKDHMIKLKYPKIYNEWISNENVAIENAESIESVIIRANIFINYVVNQNYGRVLAVTHSGFLFALYKFITNTDLSERPKNVHFPNCCSVYLDVYHSNNNVQKLELHIGEHTYVNSSSPTEMIVTTT